MSVSNKIFKYPLNSMMTSVGGGSSIDILQWHEKSLFQCFDIFLLSTEFVAPIHVLTYLSNLPCTGFGLFPGNKL